MDRRTFFRRAGLVAAAPTLGLAKVAGVKPAMPSPSEFRNGEYLTASALNDEFAKLRRAIEERTA